jgi:hypothetical protein
MDKAMQSVDEQLSHCKDDNVGHLMENNFANEFMQLWKRRGVMTCYVQ